MKALSAYVFTATRMTSASQLTTMRWPESVAPKTDKKERDSF